MSSLRVPQQNGSYKNTQNNTKTRRTLRRNSHLLKKHYMSDIKRIDTDEAV